MRKNLKYISLIILAVLAIAPLAQSAGVPLGTEPRYLIDRQGDYVNVRTDGALTAVTVDYAHHEIHSGNHYFITNAATLASGAATKILFNTPASVDGIVHILFIARSSGEANAMVYEYTTVSDVGVINTPINRNRTSSNVSATEVTFNPTVTAIGNLINEAHFGAGQNIAGEVRSLNELVLGAERLYFLNVVSEAASNDVSLTADWYEDSGDAP